MENKKLITDYTTGNIPKNLFRFALPFMLSNALQVVYSLVDMLVVGQVLGPEAVSGVTNGSAVVMFMTMVGLGFSNGGQIYIAQLIGAKRKKELSSAIGTLFTLVTVLALSLTVVGVCIGYPIFTIMGVKGAAKAFAWDYFLICAIGNIFTFGYNMVSAVLRGMGDSKRPFTFVLIASIINLVLDILFVKYLDWETAGAAWATIIGQAFAFIYALIYLYKRKEAFGFDFKKESFKIDKTAARHLTKLGIPLAIQSGAINVSMIVVNSLVNGVHVTASAVFGTGVKIDDVVNRITYGLTMAGSSMIAQNVAAGKHKRAASVFNWILVFSTIFYAIFTVILLCFSKELFGFFKREEDVIDPEYIRQFVIAAICSFPGMLIMRATNALMNGIGNSTLNLAFGLFDGVVLRISLCFILGNLCGMGLFGFFLGYGLAAYGTSLPGLFYYLTGWWKNFRMLKQEQA